jgi:phosphatidylglycerophosphatase A
MWRWRFDNVSFAAIMSGSGKLGKVLCLIAVWFGSGLVPAAPGTVGTLAALPVILLTGYLDPIGRGLSLALIVCLAVWSADFYRQRAGTEDPSEVVVDEVAGFFTAVVLWEPSWSLLLAGFLFFRFFDIFKPFPVGWAERLPGGIGIVADDLIAGAYSALALWGLHFAGVLS